jgi:hypothetical protein
MSIFPLILKSVSGFGRKKGKATKHPGQLSPGNLRGFKFDMRIGLPLLWQPNSMTIWTAGRLPDAVDGSFCYPTGGVLSTV